MASSKSSLPRRFQPLLGQAQTQAELRYGAQESGLASILGQLTRDYGRDTQAQQTAQRSLLGQLQGASTNLNKAYSDVGLSPSVLQQMAGSNPSYGRLAGELASGQAGIQQQQLGAQAGGQYLLSHLRDQYGDQVQQVSDQNQALQKERGVFTSDLLNQLIGGDRSARHDANLAAAKTAHDDQQAQIDRATSTGNALIGQGVTPIINEDGSVTLGPAIPGGKADPKSKPRTTGAGTASKNAQRTAGTSFQQAVALAQGMTKGKAHTPEVAQGVLGHLTNGVPASGGKVVYEDVPVLDSRGQPKVDSSGNPITKSQPKVDPATGERVTSNPRPAIPKFDQPIAQAATEQALYGYVTTKTVQALQKLGYSVRQIPGLITENQHRAATPRPANTAPPSGRPIAGS